MAKDYYNILGVERNATVDEIKSAYRKKALEFHPDRQVGKSDAEKKDAEEKFKEIAEAYQILSDTDKRQRYDTFGTVDDNLGGGFSTADALREFMKNMRNFGFGGKMDDFFSEFKPQNRGNDLIINVHLTFEEAYNLGRKTIRFDRDEKCSKCNGTGSSDGATCKCPRCHGYGFVVSTVRRGIAIIQNQVPCPNCGGTGSVVKDPCHECGGTGLHREEVEMTIELRPGVTNNVYDDIRGGGNACVRGLGENGTLRLVFIIDESDKYKLSATGAYDIDYVLEVGVLDCITGCTKTFKHLDGKEYRLNISPGTVNGHTIRLRNLGLCSVNGVRGFLNVRIKQIMPEKLSKDEKAAIEKLKGSKHFK